MKVTTYLQVVPRFSRWGSLLGLKVARATSKAPLEPKAGAFTLQVEIDVPDAVFKPVLAKIVVPVEHVAPVVTSVAPARVPVFVKQMGRGLSLHTDAGRGHHYYDTGCLTHVGQDPKGGDPDEWPEDLRIRQFPEVTRA